MLNEAKTLKGYKLNSRDGDIGKVNEFYFDDKHWAIRYLVVDTRNWWPGKKVLISPQWIDRVSWTESKVFVTSSREEIKRAPEYTEAALLNRDYESKLYSHYNRRGYWVDEPSVNVSTEPSNS